MKWERPCHCGRAVEGSDLDKFDESVPKDRKQCVFCWNALNSPEHRRLWGIDASAAPEPKVDIAKLPKTSRPCC